MRFFPLRRADRPLVIAHRAGNHPGSSVSGADGVEADVWHYRGRHEVRHLKTLGPLPLFWDRWAVAPPWHRPPRLEEVLARTPRALPLLLDLKRDVDAAALLPLLAATDRPLAVCSRYWHHLAALEALEVPLIYSVGSEREVRRLPGAVRGRRCDGISVHKRLLSRAVLTRLRTLAPVLFAWPIEARDVPWAVAFGLDGLITDDPMGVEDALASWTRSRPA